MSSGGGGFKTDLETGAIMKKCVTKYTQDGYERCNITFMVWLFDNHMRYTNVLEQIFFNVLLGND